MEIAIFNVTGPNKLATSCSICHRLQILFLQHSFCPSPIQFQFGSCLTLVSIWTALLKLYISKCPKNIWYSKIRTTALSSGVWVKKVKIAKANDHHRAGLSLIFARDGLPLPLLWFIWVEFIPHYQKYHLYTVYTHIRCSKYLPEWVANISVFAPVFLSYRPSSVFVSGSATGLHG